MNQGLVQFVTTVVAGAYPSVAATTGGTTLTFDDASAFDELGGELTIDEQVLAYASADLEMDTVTLAAPLPMTVGLDTFVAPYPEQSEVIATVVADGQAEEALVPHFMRAMLPEGHRDFGAEELVILGEDQYGRLYVSDLPTQEPEIDARYIPNAEELILENRRMLGEVLAENQAAIDAARTELDAAQTRLDNAFSEIDIKPDQAYVDAAKQQAIDAALAAAKVYADAAAGQAETNAKAYATTRTDGLAKTLWSTALPGTTTAPQNSVWYRTDSGGKIISVFTQTAAGSAGKTWVARPITSEAIDNLDVGKLTAASGTVNDLVANAFAAKLANIIQANIGNLTVTGNTSLNSVVAEQIAADTASFIQITASQVLAGNIQAAWTITAGGKLIAGDPTGRAVEIDDEGIVIYDVDQDGERFVSAQLGGDGADSLTLTDELGVIIAGFSSDGAVAARTADFIEDVTVAGNPLVGDTPLAGAATSLLDSLPRGVLVRQKFSTAGATRTTGEEWGYVKLAFRALAGRTYRVEGTLTHYNGNATGVTRVRLREATGTTEPTISSPELVSQLSSPMYTGGIGHDTKVHAYVGYSSDTDVTYLMTYQGLGTATPSARYAEMLVEDVGPAGSYGGAGGYSTGRESVPVPTRQTRTSTWYATDSASYRGNGTKRTDAAGDLVQGYTPYAAGNGHGTAAAVFMGTATYGETSKTISSALSGATLEKAEVYVYFNFWHSSAGGTALLSPLGAQSIQTSQTVSSAERSYPGWKRGSGRWVSVPVAWFSGTNRGITLGGGSSTSSTFYGRADGHTDPRRPAVRLTYTR